MGGGRGKKEEDEASVSPSEELRDGGALLAYRLSVSGKYHTLADNLRKPITKFVHWKLKPMGQGMIGTSQGDR